MAEKKIAGLEIKVDRPLATEAFKMQARLAYAMGGDIGDAVPLFVDAAGVLSISKNMPEDATEKDKEAVKAAQMKVGGQIASLVIGVFNRLNPDEYATLIGDIIGMAKIKRPSGHYDQADLDGDFSDNLGAVIPVAVFVLKTVFGDFFTGALASGARAMKVQG
jgi:hypothetical protein